MNLKGFKLLYVFCVTPLIKLLKTAKINFVGRWKTRW